MITLEMIISHVDTVYDEKKEKERNWEKTQAKLKDIEETRKKQESEQWWIMSGQ